MLSWPAKDPNDVLDYTLVWNLRLPEGDSIQSSLWFTDSTSPGLVMDSDSFDTETATVWLSGGVVGTTYRVTSRITTANGRTMNQSVKLKCKVK